MELQMQFPMVVSLLVFLFLVVKIVNPWKTSKSPPGPWKLPIIGHLHHLSGGLPHHSLWKLAMKHGPLMLLQLGEVPTLIVSSPKLAKEILKTNDLVFADRGSLLVPKILTDYKGLIFGTYGEPWKTLKKISILELLSAKKIQYFWSLRDAVVKELVEKVSARAQAQPGLPVNLSEMIRASSHEIISRAAFGKIYKEENEEFLSLMDEILVLAGGFHLADIFPSLTFLQRITGVKLKLEILRQKVDKILDVIINDHRVNRSVRTMEDNNNNVTKVEEDFVDVLLRAQAQAEGREVPIEDANIRPVIMEMFLAGSDTAALTSEWALSEMMRNPRIMDKAQYEARRIIDGKPKAKQSNVDELDYLRLVIKETLRLHPPSVLLPQRESREKCEIDGYVIPKGTKVLVNTWALGRDPKYWNDAETFKPERFQDVSTDYKGNDFQYIPFGAGKRICPGISFAVANVELILAQLLYHFVWKLPDGKNPSELDMTERFGASVRRKSDLYFIPTPYCSVQCSGSRDSGKSRNLAIPIPSKMSCDSCDSVPAQNKVFYLQK